MTNTLEGSALSVSLTVNDIEQSLAWYRDVVGFAVDRPYERDGKLYAVSLRAGDNVRILITQDDGKAGADRVKGAGFSMMITTSQSIDDLAAAIQSRGGTLDSQPADTPWGQRMFRIRDLNGFRYTIASPRS